MKQWLAGLRVMLNIVGGLCLALAAVMSFTNAPAVRSVVQMTSIIISDS